MEAVPALSTGFFGRFLTDVDLARLELVSATNSTYLRRLASNTDRVGFEAQKQTKSNRSLHREGAPRRHDVRVFAFRD